MTAERFPQPPALVVASHGRMSVEALNSAQQILGPIESARAVSFDVGQKLEHLADQLAVAARELDPGGERGTMVFVDLFGGSCSNVAVKLMRAEAGEGVGRVKVIAGFNLAMILEFASSRSRLGLDELAERVVTAGQKACFDVGARFVAISAGKPRVAPS